MPRLKLREVVAPDIFRDIILRPPPFLIHRYSLLFISISLIISVFISIMVTNSFAGILVLI